MSAVTCLTDPDTAVVPSATKSSDGLLVKRCAFLGITEQDCLRVRRLRVHLEEHLDGFVERFYEHLLSFPATRSFLRDAELVSRLKRAQKAYFKSLLEARLDADYVADRFRIGQAHADAGVEPEWFLGAYNSYIQDWLPYLAERYDGRLQDYVAATLSLLKLINLDIALALDAYFARATEQIRSALGMYEQTNAELQEFTNLACHDLKTPVATVTGLCEEFLDEFGDTAPEAGKRLIQAARQRALRMGAMLDDLLVASVAAAQPGRRTRVSSRSLIDEALDPLREEFEARRITVEIIAPLPVVTVQPARLRSVFQNLLSNAAKFVERKPSCVWISSETCEHEVVFCVEDEGPGIALADQHAIFAPFRRLSQHRDHAGTGLGLYFVKKLIEESGGRVWVESELGIGSRFYVSLPADAPAVGEFASRGADFEPASAAKAGGKSAPHARPDRYERTEPAQDEKERERC